MILLQPKTLYDLRRGNEDGRELVDGKPSGISVNDNNAKMTSKNSNRRSEVCFSILLFVFTFAEDFLPSVLCHS